MIGMVLDMYSFIEFCAYTVLLTRVMNIIAMHGIGWRANTNYKEILNN